MESNKSAQSGIAYLSNYGEYTTFSYGDHTIKFFTGKGLKRFVRVKQWENDIGYIVVDCENKDSTIVEDYIDLIPILENLYYDPVKYLEGIREVQLNYVD